VIPNAAGRVLRDGAAVPSQYVTGWINRGPTGVIGTIEIAEAELGRTQGRERAKIVDREASSSLSSSSLTAAAGGGLV
jgi:hypothetical protein